MEQSEPDAPRDPMPYPGRKAGVPAEVREREVLAAIGAGKATIAAITEKHAELFPDSACSPEVTRAILERLRLRGVVTRRVRTEGWRKIWVYWATGEQSVAPPEEPFPHRGEEFALAYEALRALVLDEYPGEIPEIVANWGTTDAKHLEAVRRVEAWRSVEGR